MFGLPGVRVFETAYGAGSRGLMLRGGELLGGGCWPVAYVDRHLVSTGGIGGYPTAVDDAVAGSDISAIEVYRSAAEIPPEFMGPSSACGVIVIWTHRGGGG